MVTTPRSATMEEARRYLAYHKEIFLDSIDGLKALTLEVDTDGHPFLLLKIGSTSGDPEKISAEKAIHLFMWPEPEPQVRIPAKIERVGSAK